jgi:hypothetical protein
VETTTWRKLIAEACIKNGDEFDDLTVAMDEGEMDREFYDGHGTEEGTPFTAWSEDFVYFPICYDGSEWVGSVRRNPCAIRTTHQGGG